MSRRKTFHINKWLLPFSWLYGIVVLLRNKFFEWNIFKQKTYDIPILNVGNITVGGTGKTPHIEYLIELLQKQYKIAVLSRGYKRSTKGFVLATNNMTSKQIGDEPYQISLKYPQIIVAVDNKRCRGIEILLNLPQDERPNLILLDDAFQHRYVKPSLSILLTDYNRLMVHDELLPAGRLRESVYGAERANIIIVTKCPASINPLEQRIIQKDIQAYPYQDLFFTTFQYADFQPVFKNYSKERGERTLSSLKNKSVLMVTGIANPKPLQRILQKYAKKLKVISFPDHYNFKKKDLESIQNTFNSIEESDKLIIVTEKDAARLCTLKDVADDIKPFIYYIPIKVRFINKEEQNTFNSKIIEHVENDSRNG